MCFIDLQQAFDKVKLENVLQFLRATGVSSKILQTIKKLNTQNNNDKSRQHATKKIPMTSEIRQGDSLSQIFFNLIMNEIIEEVNTAKKGFKLGKGN